MIAPRRDALAHRFIANVLPETRTWPPDLQVALHQLAFAGLPELILELRADRARAWAQDWRASMEELVRAPAQLSDEYVAFVSELVRQRAAPAAVENAIQDPERLAAAFERLGPLALVLSWRRESPAQA